MQRYGLKLIVICLMYASYAHISDVSMIIESRTSDPSMKLSLIYAKHQFISGFKAVLFVALPCFFIFWKPAWQKHKTFLQELQIDPKSPIHEHGNQIGYDGDVIKTMIFAFMGYAVIESLTFRILSEQTYLTYLGFIHVTTALVVFIVLTVRTSIIQREHFHELKRKLEEMEKHRAESDTSLS